MNVLRFDTGRNGYGQIVKYVLNAGTPRSPRGLSTLDTGPTTIVLDSALDALPLGVGRSLNPRIAAAEAIQLIGGFADAQLLVNASPNFAKYREDSGSFHGAYGRRIGSQLRCVVNKLRRDPDTRQAVITLWDPWLDNAPDKKDYPCTVALNLAIVNNELELRVVMRSNDVWLGLPYDMFQFTQLQLTVANVLGIETGPYTHTTWSLHLYEEHAVAASQLPVQPTKPTEEVSLEGLGWVNETLEDLQQRAALIPTKLDTSDLTETEEWYHAQLFPLTQSSAYLG